MNNTKRNEMFCRLSEANPEPKTELAYATDFELLIAVILSAQATDVSVNKATSRLYPVANTPDAILELGVDGLTPYIRTIGLFNTKAKNVIEACRVLCEQHEGQVPQSREALEALPGVGRKTANVVLNTAFRQIAMAVDTHIFRVSNRTGLAPGKTVLAVEKALLKFVPNDYLLDAHHWLILHGRYVCLARTPRCPQCPINDLCDYRHKTTFNANGKLVTDKAASKTKSSHSQRREENTTLVDNDAGKGKAGSKTRSSKKNTSRRPTGKKIKEKEKVPAKDRRSVRNRSAEGMAKPSLAGKLTTKK